MDITKIHQFFEEASKILNLDSSHDAIRQKVQASISAKHRKDNSDDSSASYYNTPYVRDVFGTEDGGQVVHSKDGKMTLSQYKKNKTGSYDIANDKNVKHAYVVTNDHDGDEKKESMSILIDGREVLMQESVTVLDEVTEFQESGTAASGKMKVTLISAGKGSQGYYTEEALKQAAADGIFPTGTQMFLNHATPEERRVRPEGDITKLAAKTTSPSVYVPPANGKPGKLVAEANAYPEYAPFLASRKDDIGVSVRVGAATSGKMREGVPLVESMAYALSADFVTKAGRGGKIEEMYESYRGSNHDARLLAAGEASMTDQEKEQFRLLQESAAKQTARLDRLSEQNNNLRASIIVSESLVSSGLSFRGQKRINGVVLASIPVDAAGELDEIKLQESVKAAIVDELAYLQESGAPKPTPHIVRSQGAQFTSNGAPAFLQESQAAADPAADTKVLQEASTTTDAAIGSILGRKEKATA